MSDTPVEVAVEQVAVQRADSVKGYAIWARDVVARAFAESRGRSKATGTISIQELKVEKGAILGIAGGLDAAMGTFFQLLAGSVRPDAGEIFLSGRRPTRGRRDVGLASYRFALYDELTVGENLALLDKLASEAAAGKMHISKILEALDIGGLTNTKYRDLSEPDRRLVLLAQAMLKAPTLVLVENMLTGLDMLECARVVGILSRMIGNGQDVTYVIGTSLYDEGLFALFTDIALIEQGRVTKAKHLAEQSPSVIRQSIVECLSAR